MDYPVLVQVVNPFGNLQTVFPDSLDGYLLSSVKQLPETAIFAVLQHEVTASFILKTFFGLHDISIFERLVNLLLVPVAIGLELLVDNLKHLHRYTLTRDLFLGWSLS